MKFTIYRTSQDSCDDLPGVTKVERWSERRTPYRYMHSLEDFKKWNPTIQITGEYTDAPETGIVYLEDTSYWTVELDDLAALTALVKFAGKEIAVQEFAGVADEFALEIIDDYRE